MENKSKPSTKNNMGLAIAMGAGVGLLFGEFLFDHVGIGLCLGAGAGMIFGYVQKSKS